MGTNPEHFGVCVSEIASGGGPLSLAQRASPVQLGVILLAGLVFAPGIRAQSPLFLGFTPGENFPVGSLAASVVVADFNLDGKPDLATANSDKTVTVLLGNGRGGFYPASGSPFGVGSNPRSIAVADFNGDGYADLAVANLDDNTVTVLLGDGTGRFMPDPQGPFPAGNYPQSVAVGDFNGDGKIDLAIANAIANEGGVTVLLNLGGGAFAAGTTFPAGNTPVAVAVGDFNRDGKADLVVANYYGNNVTVLLGDGSGAFTEKPGSPFNAGSYPFSVAVGDFDGDGKPDLAFGNDNTGSVTVLLGDGSGGFAPSLGSPFAVGNNPQDAAGAGESIAVGDFNGDGRLDLAVADSVLQFVTVLMGDGSGGFTPAPGSPFFVETLAISAAAADFNGDGQLDLAVVGNSVTVLLNALPSLSTPAHLDFYAGIGRGAPAAISLPVTSQPGPASMYTVTSDQPWLSAFPTSSATGGTSNINVSVNPGALSAGTFKGALHFLAPNYFGSVTTVTLNLSNPSAALLPAAGSPYPVGQSPESVAVGDFNGDGIPDLVVANSDDNNLTFLLNDGFGNFTPAGTLAAGMEPWSVAVGDFNGDGKTDLAVSNFNDNNVMVFLGNGNGGFTQATYAVGNGPISIAVADFNRDGNPDLAVANQYGGVTILLGNARGQFIEAAGSPFVPGSGPVSVAVGDLNGDGNADLVTANFTNVTVLLGDGAGGFMEAPGSPIPVPGAPAAVAVGDLDGNGIPDLAVANSDQNVNTVTVLLGDGSGRFAAAPGSPFTAGVGYSVAIGDFNGDGKPDVAVTGFGNNSISMLLGDGAGGFALAPGGGDLNPVSLAAADFNADGRLDLAVGDFHFGTVSVLLGSVSAVNTTVLTTTAPNPVPLGQDVPLRAEVSRAGMYFSPGIPTGTVTFVDGVSTLGTVSLSNGVATFTAQGLSAGPHFLVAGYSGDASNLGGGSGGLSLTVQGGQTSQTIMFPALSDMTFGTAPFTISATASSGLAVTFSSTTQDVCTVSVSLVTLIKVGTCTITAMQPGNATYSAAPPVSQSFMVALAPPPPVSIVVNETITVTDAPSLPDVVDSENIHITDQVMVRAFYPIAIAPASLLSGVVNHAYSSTAFTGTGGFGGLVLSETGSIPGIQFSSAGASLTLSGTPTAASPAGGYSFTVTAQDSVGNTLQQNYSLIVTAACPAISVSPSGSLGTLTVGAPFSQIFTSTGGVGTIAWSSPGGLPNWVTFSPGGVLSLSGPPVSGTLSLNILATDQNGCAGSSTGVSLLVVPPPAVISINENITVTDAPSFPDINDSENIHVTDPVTVRAFYPIAIAPAPLLSGVASHAFPSTTFTGTGGFGGLVLSETGSIPGIQFSSPGASLILSGTPTAVSPAGGYPFTVTARDSVGNTLQQNYSLIVTAACPAISVSPSGSLGTLTVGSPFSQIFTATGGVGNIAWSAPSALPNWIAFSPGGVLSVSGTPAPGTLSLNILATDQNGCASQSTGVSLLVVPPPAVISINETIKVTDAPSLPDLVDSESIHVTDQVTVRVLNATTTSIAISGGSVYGTPANATVSVSSATAAVTGNVTLSLDGGAPASTPLSGGSATFHLGVLTVGGHTLAANFPAQGSFLASSSQASLTVNPPSAVQITWSNPAAITYGTALSATQLNATASVAGSFVYVPAVGAVLAAGSQKLSVTFTPTDTVDYKTGTASVTLVVNQAAPAITWSNPAAINQGTALSATQLNAKANVAGKFVYTPPAETVLPAGTSTLSETFTPTDTTDYTTATATVSIEVNVNGNLTISSGTYTFVNGKITGNVVMSGGSLVLNDATISGNLQMSGGSLLLTNNSTVQGNLQITGGGSFSVGPSHIFGELSVQNIPAGTVQNQICSATVNGNLTFQNNRTALLIGSPSCAGNTISGNVQVTNNSAATEVYGNTVSGNVQVTGNSAATQIDDNKVSGNLQMQNNTASTAIFSNTVKGNLQCSGNNAAQITGGGNTAAQKQGQCAGF